MHQGPATDNLDSADETLAKIKLCLSGNQYADALDLIEKQKKKSIPSLEIRAQFSFYRIFCLNRTRSKRFSAEIITRLLNSPEAPFLEHAMLNQLYMMQGTNLIERSKFDEGLVSLAQITNENPLLYIKSKLMISQTIWQRFKEQKNTIPSILEPLEIPETTPVYKQLSLHRRLILALTKDDINLLRAVAKTLCKEIATNMLLDLKLEVLAAYLRPSLNSTKCPFADTVGESLNQHIDLIDPQEGYTRRCYRAILDNFNIERAQTISPTLLHSASPQSGRRSPSSPELAPSCSFSALKKR